VISSKIFAVKNEIEYIGMFSGVQCPSCKTYGRFEANKVYKSLNLFSASIFKWNIKYIAASFCCKHVFELKPDIGIKYEQNRRTKIRTEDLIQVDKRLYFKQCNVCGIGYKPNFNFCPHCGVRL